MYVIIGHRATEIDKNRRLVHIVPYAVDSGSHKILVKPGPPGTYIRTRKIREMAFSGPHLSAINPARRIPDKTVALKALFIHEIALLGLYPRVYHIYRLEIQSVQIVVESLGVGEIRRIKGEDFVLVHIMDIHITSQGILCSLSVSARPATLS